MAVSLRKGENRSLSGSDPDLKNVLIGLGWEPRAGHGDDFDLDASIFMLTDSGKVKNDEGFIFYNKLKSDCGSVEHTGDNRTGDGDGDDESIIVHLDKVPADIAKLVVVVTIDDAEAKKQNFGQVGGAFIRLVNDDTGVEIMRFDLSEDYSVETGMVFGEVYKRPGTSEFKFRAVGEGVANGLLELCERFGVSVE